MVVILLFVLAVSIFFVIKNLNAIRERLSAEGIIQTLEYQDKRILGKYFGFYRKLPLKSKRIFEYRVGRFMKLTQFVPREMKVVTREMQVLISASAVQITFGFDDVLLSHFERIIVYPDQYFSNSAQRYHKGEVNPSMGVIVLSWKHFAEGYASEEGVNLGLHEMAHALQLENVILNSEYGFMSDDAIQHWQQLAEKEITLIQTDQSHFFRKYGGTNQAEFFSVAVENFFERPLEFAAYNSDLYESMCRLLKQNPILLKST